MTPTTSKNKKVATTKDAYIEAVGRRKTSVARIRLMPAKQMAYSCNDRTLENYFPVEELRGIVRSPIEEMAAAPKFAISVHVKGGGIRSQAEAIRQGIARALSLSDHDLRKPLKQLGFLTRDARAKERRKFGLKKARKAPQWSKR